MAHTPHHPHGIDGVYNHDHNTGKLPGHVHVGDGKHMPVTDSSGHGAGAHGHPAVGHVGGGDAPAMPMRK